MDPQIHQTDTGDGGGRVYRHPTVEIEKNDNQPLIVILEKSTSSSSSSNLPTTPNRSNPPNSNANLSNNTSNSNNNNMCLTPISSPWWGSCNLSPITNAIDSHSNPASPTTTTPRIKRPHSPPSLTNTPSQLMSFSNNNTNTFKHSSRANPANDNHSSSYLAPSFPFSSPPSKRSSKGVRHELALSMKSEESKQNNHHMNEEKTNECIGDLKVNIEMANGENDPELIKITEESKTEENSLGVDGHVVRYTRSPPTGANHLSVNKPRNALFASPSPHRPRRQVDKNGLPSSPFQGELSPARLIRRPRSATEQIEKADDSSSSTSKSLSSHHSHDSQMDAELLSPLSAPISHNGRSPLPLHSSSLHSQSSTLSHSHDHRPGSPRSPTSLFPATPSSLLSPLRSALTSSTPSSNTSSSSSHHSAFSFLSPPRSLNNFLPFSPPSSFSSALTFSPAPSTPSPASGVGTGDRPIINRQLSPNTYSNIFSFNLNLSSSAASSGVGSSSSSSTGLALGNLASPTPSGAAAGGGRVTASAVLAAREKDSLAPAPIAAVGSSVPVTRKEAPRQDTSSVSSASTGGRPLAPDNTSLPSHQQDQGTEEPEDAQRTPPHPQPHQQAGEEEEEEEDEDEEENQDAADDAHDSDYEESRSHRKSSPHSTSSSSVGHSARARGKANSSSASQYSSSSASDRESIAATLAMAGIRPGAAPSGPHKPCNCKKSKCLKLYCECFARQEYCEGCNCVGCNNNARYADVRDKAMAATIERDPHAFFRSSGESTQEMDLVKHPKGCHCKKSECLKKYCECYQAGVPCSDMCKCTDCKNGRHDHHHQSGGGAASSTKKKKQNTAAASSAFDMNYSAKSNGSGSSRKKSALPLAIHASTSPSSSSSSASSPISHSPVSGSKLNSPAPVGPANTGGGAVSIDVPTGGDFAKLSFSSPVGVRKSSSSSSSSSSSPALSSSVGMSNSGVKRVTTSPQGKKSAASALTSPSIKRQRVDSHNPSLSHHSLSRRDEIHHTLVMS